MTGSVLSTAMAAQASKLPLATVGFLVSAGIVIPSIKAPAGRGTSRRFSFADVCALRLIAQSRRFTIAPTSLREAVREVQARALAEGPRTDALVVVRFDGTVVTVSVKDKQATLASALRGSPTSIVVDVDAIVEETREPFISVLMLKPSPPARGRRPKAAGSMKLSSRRETRTRRRPES